ncbi:hypothetical protein FRC03_004710 [Tulasnella sp. 419]|nr:hypothetical protein FRC02_011313 [Tulasnella sp. 418]KAG8969036.1 hypothetical protein FRC03_004710 [Tulasnella sp. 419]
MDENIKNKRVNYSKDGEVPLRGTQTDSSSREPPSTRRRSSVPRPSYRQLSSIDEHAQFWSTYDSISGSFDNELLEGWNKSLDVLLIFAGLFSAINTAFIIESYKGLSADPAQTTNELLRLLITHRDDREISTDSLYPVSPSPSAVPVNSLFFSSLSLNLTAAFGAVTAKQWLTDYATVGTLSALHDKGPRRQEKFNKLQDWQLRLIIELLPMLLQISVFLFFAGVFCFLQPLNGAVATLQLVLSCVVFGAYLISVVIGILFPSSPFQSPLSKGIRRLGRTICRPLPLIVLYIPVHVLVMTAFFPMTLALYLLDEFGFSTANALYLKGEAFMEKLRLKALGISGNQWETREIAEVDSVVWLLEQAKHPDVVLIALNTATMLPPHILLSRIRIRQGLLARILDFHEKQLLETAQDEKEWFAMWPTSAIISGMALLHVVKMQPPDDYFSIIRDLPRFVIRLAASSNFGLIPHNLLRNQAAISAARLSINLLREAHDPQSLDNLSYLLLQPIQLPLPELHPPIVKSDRGGDRLGPSRSVLPLSLFLDAFIYLIHYKHDFTPDLMVTETDIKAALHVLGAILKGRPSQDIVGHISLALLAIHWRSIFSPSSSTWIQTPKDTNQMIYQSFIAGHSIIDKGAMVLEHTSHAISVMNMEESDDVSKMCQNLLRLTEERFVQWLVDHLPPANFAQGLFRLTRAAVGEVDTLSRVARLLALLGIDDWISHVHHGNVNGFTILLDAVFLQDQSRLGEQTLKAVARLLQLVSQLPDEQFLQIYSVDGLERHQPRIVELMTSAGEFNGLFVRKVLSLVSSRRNRCTLFKLQIELVIQFLNLIQYKPYEIGFRANGYGTVQDFFNCVLEDCITGYWPSYFTAAGIVESRRGPNGEQITADFTFIDSTRFLRVMNEARERGDVHLYRVWIGEAILILWQAVSREQSTGAFPPDWIDDVFFQDQGVIAILNYYINVIEQQYGGVDHNLCKQFLAKALTTESTRSTKDSNLLKWLLDSYTNAEKENVKYGWEDRWLELCSLRRRKIELILDL